MRLYLKITNKRTQDYKLVDTSFFTLKEVIQIAITYYKSKNFKVGVIIEWEYMKMFFL